MTVVFADETKRIVAGFAFQQDFRAEQRLTRIFGLHAGERPGAQLGGHNILGKIEIAGVVHMSVLIDIAVRNRERTCTCQRLKSRNGGQRNLVPRYNGGDVDPVLIGERCLSRFAVHQRPKRTGFDQRAAGSILYAVKARKQQMPDLPRPGDDFYGFVVGGHPVNDCLLQRHDPK